MRVILFAAVLAAAPLGGEAQTLDPYANDNLRWMEQERLRRQTDQLERDMLALDNRLRANEAIQDQRNLDLDTAVTRARIARNLSTAPSTLAPVRATDIPDDRLAASNARVRAASGHDR
jgi:hypothetical protein